MTFIELNMNLPSPIESLSLIISDVVLHEKPFIINPFNPVCHLRDDMQNQEGIFCVLSSSWTTNIIWCVQKKITSCDYE